MQPIDKSDAQPATKADARAVADDLDKLALATKNSFDSVDERFDEVDKRFDRVDQRFDRLESKVDGLGDKVASLDSKVDSLDSKFDTMNQGINQRLDHLVELIGDVPERVTKLEQKASFHR